MNATELRIGNLIMYNQSIEKVEGVNMNTVDIFFNHCASITKPINLIQPIPLTEEMLKQSGFIRDEDTLSDIIYYIMITDANKKQHKIELRKDSDCFELQYPRVAIKINSVHQLQNLYFTLIQKELDIQLH